VYKLLFLCTGNYYRSRFAELLCNALAPVHHLPWQALSRGVALAQGVGNVGPMSPLAIQTLQALGITSDGFTRYPMQVQEDDFQGAEIIIALQEAEHRPYLHTRYPAWVDKVEYWHVRDCVPTLAYDPLHEISREVRQLLLRLSTS
jgi:protein-tyrosine phosphatase